MPKNSEDVDEAAETVELDGAGKKDGKKNAKRQRQRRSRNKRVKILGITAAVIIVILIIVGAWFIYTSLHDGRPEWLQTIPGLHYRPINEKVENLISYRGPEESSYKPWVAVIDKFLEEYSHPRNNVMICDFDKFPQEDYFCEVNLKDFGYCKKENLYGYNRQAPCIFIKLHKFPNWIPEYYNDTSDLPEKMPPVLVEHIENVVAHNSLEWQTLWLDCDGITDVDKENIGAVEYYPDRGFRGYYFPASDKEGYLSPLVALHLANPRIGVLINIECKVWAKNIPVDSESGVGVVQFEILID